MNKKNTNPLVSIIIINWNGGEVMQDCLQSLSAIDYPNIELIIVDNGSKDGSEDIAKEFKFFKSLRIIKNTKNLGFAPANNQAFTESKGKYILLLNNDTKVEKNFLSLLVHKMEEESSFGVIQPKIFMIDKVGYLDNAGSFMTQIGFLSHWGFMEKDSKEFSSEKEVFSAKGACMLIKREVIEKVGLFDKEFFSYFEESDFCWRVWLAGYKVVFYPESKIYHKVGFTIRRLDVFNINFHYYKNRICSLIKNLGTKNLHIVLLFHLIVSIGIAGLFFIRLQPKNGFMILAAIWWNIVNMLSTLEKRHQIQSIRVVTDHQLFETKHLMSPIDWAKYFEDFKRVEKDLKR